MYLPPSPLQLRLLQPTSGVFEVFPDKTHYLAPVGVTYGIFSMDTHQCISLLEGKVDLLTSVTISERIMYGTNHTVIIAACTNWNTDVLPFTSQYGIKVWDKNTGKFLQEFDGKLRSNAVVSDYLIEGKQCLVIIARCVSEIRIWRLDNGQIVQKLTADDDRYSSMAVSESPLGSFIVTAGELHITIRSLKNWQHKSVIDTQNGSDISCFITAGYILSGKKYHVIISGHGDGKIAIWNIENQTCLRTIIPAYTDTNPVTHLIVSEEIITGQLFPVIISVASDNKICVWRLDTGELLRTFEDEYATRRYAGEIECMVAARRKINDKEYPIIMSGGADRLIQTRCLKTGRLLARVPSLQQLAMDTARRNKYWQGIPNPQECPAALVAMFHRPFIKEP